MTIDEALASMKRLLPYWYKTGEGSEAYIRSIHEACLWIPGPQFDLVCRELAKTYKPKGAQPLAAAGYLEMHQTLKARGAFGDSQPSAYRPPSPAEADEWCYREACELRGAGARWVIEQVEAGKVRYSDRVMAVLVERAGLEYESGTPKSQSA